MDIASLIMEVRIQGQVVHIRKLSKKIAFFDIEHSDGLEKTEYSDEMNVKTRKCVVLKTWNCGEEVMEKAVKTNQRIHVGDFVAFTGSYEKNDSTFCAENFEIKIYWTSQNPGIVFEAKPPPDQDKETKRKNGETSPEQPVGLCKYFLNTGQCPKTSCKFSHAVEVGAREEVVQEVKKRRAQAHEEALGGQEGISGANRRARVFAEWILEKYNRDWLKDGLILDVGGGRGDLAFELATR